MTGEAGKQGAAPHSLRRGFPSGRLHALALATRAMAGLLGAAGIVVAAAAAHRGGGELASTAATFMLVHAVAALCLATSAQAGGRGSAGLLIAAGLLIVGTVLFSGDLALAGLLNWRPWPTAAPIGGTMLIVGWLAVPVATVFDAVARRGREPT